MQTLVQGVMEKSGCRVRRIRDSRSMVVSICLVSDSEILGNGAVAIKTGPVISFNWKQSLS